MAHQWNKRDDGQWECEHCRAVAMEAFIAAVDRQPCGGVPVTNIASARVAKAQYAKDITPADCLRATLAELEAGLPCTSLVIVIGNAGPAVAATTLRLAGGTNYFERVGLLDAAKEVLMRDAALPTERS